MSNQHSDEAIAEFPDDNRTPYMKEIEPEPLVLSMQRTAFDRGRESKQHTDRETLAKHLARVASDWLHNECGEDGHDLEHSNWEAYLQDADALLASPSLSLVAARRDFAEKASAHMRANGHGFTRRIDMELLYDALFASGILKPSSGHTVWVAEDGSRHDHPVAGSGHWVHESRSEVEAAALEAVAVEIDAYREAHQNDDRAYRSGLGDASQIVRLRRAARFRSGKAEA